MRPNQYKFKAKVWLHPGGGGAWHLASIPPAESKDIKSMFGGLAHGWGSLPVKATIGQTTWQTSIFPDKKKVAISCRSKPVCAKQKTLAMATRFPYQLK